MIERKSPTLYWDSTYAIAVALMADYPDVDPEKVGLHELADMIFTLSGFNDSPDLANERILTDIQITWYEELNSE